MPSSAATVDAYLAGLPAERRAVVAVRDAFIAGHEAARQRA